jgi:hypothetical protein
LIIWQLEQDLLVFFLLCMLITRMAWEFQKQRKISYFMECMSFKQEDINLLFSLAHATLFWCCELTDSKIMSRFDNTYNLLNVIIWQSDTRHHASARLGCVFRFSIFFSGHVLDAVKGCYNISLQSVLSSVPQGSIRWNSNENSWTPLYTILWVTAMRFKP